MCRCTMRATTSTIKWMESVWTCTFPYQGGAALQHWVHETNYLDNGLQPMFCTQLCTSLPLAMRAPRALFGYSTPRHGGLDGATTPRQVVPRLDRGLLDAGIYNPAIHQLWMCYCIYARLPLDDQRTATEGKGSIIAVTLGPGCEYVMHSTHSISSLPIQGEFSKGHTKSNIGLGQGETGSTEKCVICIDPLLRYLQRYKEYGFKRARRGQDTAMGWRRHTRVHR